MSREELLEIKGGNITATFLNAIVRGITVICEVGRNIGTALRRVIAGNICPLN